MALFVVLPPHPTPRTHIFDLGRSHYQRFIVQEREADQRRVRSLLKESTGLGRTSPGTKLRGLRLEKIQFGAPTERVLRIYHDNLHLLTSLHSRPGCRVLLEYTLPTGDLAFVQGVIRPAPRRDLCCSCHTRKVTFKRPVFSSVSLCAPVFCVRLSFKSRRLSQSLAPRSDACRPVYF